MGAGRVIAAFALVYVPFMLFRYATFSLWWPHSFYAKRTHDGIFSTVYDMLTSPGALVDKIYSAVSAPFGSFGLWFFVAQLIGLFYLRKTHQLARIHLVGLLLQLTGLAAFIFLDHDWMGEFRFATIFTVFSLSLLLWTIARLPARISHLIAAVCTLLLLGNFGLRLLNFAAKPTVPFAGIARNKAEKYNRYKEIIGGNEISVLTYDLGAVLYYAQMKVYDLAGLCDTETVKYLKKGTIFWLDDHPEFYDYVFSEIKPTLIETSGFFTHITAFDKDPRFSRDYSAIDGFGDYTYLGEHSGIFVRKDALTRPGLLQDLQNGYQPGPISLPLLLRLEELLGFATPALSQEVGMERGLFFQMKKNNLWRAERSYRQVLALNPEHFGALFRLAKVLDAQERTFEARPYWERVRERAEASRDALVLEDARTRLR
jgi:tetratricopeptide (TPR) repeat protein